MRSDTELLSSAREERPFSNSSEGSAWTHAHCLTCVHDKATRQGREWDGCPLIAISMGGYTPAEWIPDDPTVDGGWDSTKLFTCVEYSHEDNGGNWEPKPIPDPPGQLELFPRDGLEGTRMLVPLGAAKADPLHVECDGRFPNPVTVGAGPGDCLKCGMTYQEYGAGLGERIADGLEAASRAKAVCAQ